ncbi:recombinase family protein [Fictibacillus sp. KIGAM418]|uniref:Recombinase family protein n=1 Tax=Fictibacillus marinisediminis TaxID=2878389 RepID=A0A9X2BC69_9BACL|nr:recombinase family protein [Fictibacillus marinisediminis]MCK6255430.1 recombinase family protein [Fictibacillus marinisediminis]
MGFLIWNFLIVVNPHFPDATPTRRIYKEYLEGSGRESIARRLYNEGFKTPADIAGKK